MAKEVNGMSRHENIITNIKPSTAIRHDYNSFSKLCHETQNPVVVTKNGEADLVVMSHEAYQKMISRHRLGQMLSEVDHEIASGKPMRDFEETFAAIKKRIENE
jgi:PHD/YefM family antitoxin component YafN of YafNO toxin-antitoxin module